MTLQMTGFPIILQKKLDWGDMDVFLAAIKNIQVDG